MKTSKTNIPTSIDNRDIEIAKLKEALAKAELRAQALDTMIDIAEENFKIKISKKLAPNSDAPAQPQSYG